MLLNKKINILTIALTLASAYAIEGATSFEQLIEGIKNKDLGAVKKILDAEPKLISKKDEEYKRAGDTPLLLAIKEAKTKEEDPRDQGLIKLLLTYKQNLEEANYLHQTPLLWGATRKRKDLIKLLLDAGADKNAKIGDRGETAYVLMKRLGDPAAPGYASETADARAQRLEYSEIAELLKPSTTVAPEVKAAAATTTPTPPPAATSAAFEQLIEAIRKNNIPLITKMLDAEPNLVYEKDSAGQTLLNIAAFNARVVAHPLIIVVLLDYGADVNTQDKWGETPLIHAASKKNSNLVRILLAAGADPALKNNDNETAIIRASQGGEDTDIIESLREYEKIPPKTRAANGVFYNLINAIQHNKPKAVAILLRNPALNINAQDEESGQTLLIFATSKGFVDIVQLLLGAGADINITDKNGETAYDWAVKLEQLQPNKNFKAIADLLMSTGKLKAHAAATQQPTTPVTGMAVGNELALLANQLTALATQTK